MIYDYPPAPGAAAPRLLAVPPILAVHTEGARVVQLVAPGTDAPAPVLVLVSVSVLSKMQYHHYRRTGSCRRCSCRCRGRGTARAAPHTRRCPGTCSEEHRALFICHTYPQHFLKFLTWPLTVVYYKVNYLPVGVRIWFWPNCRIRVLGDTANFLSEIG